MFCNALRLQLLNLQSVRIFRAYSMLCVQITIFLVLVLGVLYHQVAKALFSAVWRKKKKKGLPGDKVKQMGFPREEIIT